MKIRKSLLATVMSVMMVISVTSTCFAMEIYDPMSTSTTQTAGPTDELAQEVLNMAEEMGGTILYAGVGTSDGVMPLNWNSNTWQGVIVPMSKIQGSVQVPSGNLSIVWGTSLEYGADPSATFVCSGIGQTKTLYGNNSTASYSLGPITAGSYNFTIREGKNVAGSYRYAFCFLVT